jgi:hypothetical protein
MAFNILSKLSKSLSDSVSELLENRKYPTIPKNIITQKIRKVKILV